MPSVKRWNASTSESGLRSPSEAAACTKPPPSSEPVGRVAQAGRLRAPQLVVDRAHELLVLGHPFGLDLVADDDLAHAALPFAIATALTAGAAARPGRARPTIAPRSDRAAPTPTAG